MFKSLEIFKISHAMASHAATRQTVVAQNMANADTPGYVARDLVPFTEIYESAQSSRTMRATRAGHHGNALEASPITPRETLADTSPNGNTVSLEEEMIKSANVKSQHDRALAIYKSSMNVLRTTIGS